MKFSVSSSFPRHCDTFNGRSTPKQQLSRLHVPLDSSGVTSGIAANRSGQQHTSPSVCPTMKNASSSCDPYKTKDADYLDKVQRRAARYACNNYTERTQGCVTAMVNSLGWETLQDRRKMQCLTMLFKIKKNNLVEIPEAVSIVWSNDS